MGRELKKVKKNIAGAASVEPPLFFDRYHDKFLIFSSQIVCLGGRLGYSDVP